MAIKSPFEKLKRGLEKIKSAFETRKAAPVGISKAEIDSLALKERLKVIKQEEVDFRKPYPVATLSKTTTDWRRLYDEVSRNRHKVKGLRKSGGIASTSWTELNTIVLKVGWVKESTLTRSRYFKNGRDAMP